MPSCLLLIVFSNQNEASVKFDFSLYYWCTCLYCNCMPERANNWKIKLFYSLLTREIVLYKVLITREVVLMFPGQFVRTQHVPMDKSYPFCQFVPTFWSTHLFCIILYRKYCFRKKVDNRERLTEHNSPCKVKYSAW